MIKNAGKDKDKQGGYIIGFDAHSMLSQKKERKRYLILGKSPRDGLNGNTITELIKLY